MLSNLLQEKCWFVFQLDTVTQRHLKFLEKSLHQLQLQWHQVSLVVVKVDLVQHR